MAIHANVLAAQISVTAHGSVGVFDFDAGVEPSRKQQLDRAVHRLSAQFARPLFARNIDLNRSVLRIELHISATSRVRNGSVSRVDRKVAGAVLEAYRPILRMKRATAGHGAYRH